MPALVDRRRRGPINVRYLDCPGKTTTCPWWIGSVRQRQQDNGSKKGDVKHITCQICTTGCGILPVLNPGYCPNCTIEDAQPESRIKGLSLYHPRSTRQCSACKADWTDNPLCVFYKQRTERMERSQKSIERFQAIDAINKRKGYCSICNGCKEFCAICPDYLHPTIPGYVPCKHTKEPCLNCRETGNRFKGNKLMRLVRKKNERSF